MNKRIFVIPTSFFLAATALIALVGFFNVWATGAQPTLAAPADVITPTLAIVNPTTSFNDMDTPIVISGTNFTAELSGTRVLTAPLAYLGSTLLENITWVNSTTLNAVAPWGMVPGAYTMTVANPNGGVAVLPNAFTVINGIGVFTTGGPYGGYIVDLAHKPGSPGTLYVLAGYSGLFASQDGGEQWEMIHSNMSATDLAFDAQNAEVMYLGSGTGEAVRTLDGGNTWERLFPDPFLNYCMLVYPAAHPVDAGVVYAGVGGCDRQPLGTQFVGVYQSTDYGSTWITRTTGMTDTNIHALAINPQNPLTMLAGTANGNLYATLDGGENWSLNTNLGKPILNIYFNPYELSQAWVFVRDETTNNDLYRSTNLSAWMKMNVDTNGSPSMQMDFLPDSVWVGGGSVYSSTDNGAIWNEIPGIHGTASAVAVSPDQPQVIYAGTDMGLDLSTDSGASWREINQGLSGLFPLTLAASPGDLQTVYAKPYQGIYRSFNGGSSWQSLNHGKGGNTRHNLKVDPFAPNRVYYGLSCQDAFCLDVSTDNGDTWNIITASIPVTYAGHGFEVSAVAPHPQIAGRILAGASVRFLNFTPWEKSWGFVYASDDYGQSWTQTGPTQPISRVEEIVYDAVDPDLVYVGTDGSGFWKSTDGGLTWHSTPHLDGNRRVVNIASHATISGRLVINAIDEFQQGGSYISQDAGDEWTLLDGLVGSAPLIYTATYPPSLYGFYGVAGAYGLGRSLDDGLSWEMVAGAPWPECLAAATDGERVVLYVGSPGSLGAPAGRQTPSPANSPFGETPISGGVYRFTTLLPDHWLFLPLVTHVSAP